MFITDFKTLILYFENKTLKGKFLDLDFWITAVFRLCSNTPIISSLVAHICISHVRDIKEKKEEKNLVENGGILVGMSRIFIKDYKYCRIFNYNINS